MIEHLHATDLAPAIAQIHDRHGWLDAQIPQQTARLLQLLGLPGKLRAHTIEPLQALTAIPTLTPNAYG